MGLVPGAERERKDDWVTPWEDFLPLCDEFRFTVDAAASAENHRVPYYWNEETNGLSQDWSGERVWCNPPYSNIYPWVEKAARKEAEVAVLLLPPSIDTAWFHDFIWDSTTHKPRTGVEIRFRRGRIKFQHHTDKKKVHPPSGNLIAIFYH